MPFNAIVHAPRLRPGARLNIAEADQTEARRPCLPKIGAEIRLRIGVCAPELACGRIIGCAEEPDCVDPEAVDAPFVDLAVGEATWRLRRSEHGGITAPGLVSEAWYVVGAIDGPASPIHHSPAHSPADTAAED